MTERDTVVHRARTMPSASLTKADVNYMLLDMKMTLVSITNLLGDTAPEKIRDSFDAGYDAAGLNDAICITDDDDDPENQPVAQVLRHIFLRLTAVYSGILAIDHKLQWTKKAFEADASGDER